MREVAKRLKIYFFLPLLLEQPSCLFTNPTVRGRLDIQTFGCKGKQEDAMKKNLAIVAIALFAVALGGALARADQMIPSPGNSAGIEQKVRHELVTLPFYSVYDDLNYSVMGGTVTLTGQVMRPTLKSDAEAAVKRVPGVSTVVNQIEVLPLSPSDNSIRWAAYRTLFNYNSPLHRYGLGAVPNIHIVVKNGHVTLKGVVSTSFDKQIASTYINHVFGVFSVTNDLRVGELS
jgi:hyperosmotically inducible protein